MNRMEYVPVKIGGFFVNGGREYRSVIDEYCRRGYRYVGWVPTRIVGYGKISEIDLIFEYDG